MNSVEFADALAAFMKCEATQLRTVNRALAKAGLREKSRGRHRPDVSLREALLLLLGWAGADNFVESAKSAEYQASLEGFRPANDELCPLLFGKEFSDLDCPSFIDALEMICRRIPGGLVDVEELFIRIEHDGISSVGVWRDGSRFSDMHFSGVSDNVGPSRYFRIVEIHGAVLEWISRNAK